MVEFSILENKVEVLKILLNWTDFFHQRICEGDLSLMEFAVKYYKPSCEEVLKYLIEIHPKDLEKVPVREN